MELASKSSHSHIINDESVQAFLSNCILPPSAEGVDFQSENDFLLSVDYSLPNPILHVFAIDGGYTEVNVKNEFPSSTLSFFQFGASGFSVSDLDEISYKPFIDPKDIAKLKNIQRFKMTLPTKNVVIRGQASLTHSIRKTLYDFFIAEPREGKPGANFMHTLKWFIFEEYSIAIAEWRLSRCPHCELTDIPLKRAEMDRDFTFVCPGCKNTLYLTDVFRLHEAIDDELGAGGILGYLTTLLEQMVLVHLIRTILSIKSGLLQEMLFIKDGPLAFFGQTANLHKPMRKLSTYLMDNFDLFLAGLEKSGPFVEHADVISRKMDPGTVLLLSNNYIYSYILPGIPDIEKPYARSSYYGAKLIFKSREGRMYVITLPTRDPNVVLAPKKNEFKNLDVILQNVERLKCDMYDSALIPIALVNRLVSLANHPSSVILEKFARSGISK